ncbi:anti-sigma factor [Mesorhizobium sp. 1B3]|uniref:anti-sigma factor n=1 Tax=Mesorhizobium sp. 1B3 TaxID=3243599 RepID=UPI003D976983
MTLTDEHGPEPSGDDILAAEYVLGVLSSEERRVVAARIDSEPDFAHLVDSWEAHLGPLASAYTSVEPPAGAKAAIDRRLFGPSAAAGPDADEAAIGRRIWSSLAFWRGLAAVALAALVLYVAIPAFTPPTEPPAPRLVASLSAEGSDVRYLAVYDEVRGEVSLSHVSGQRAQDRDFELWMIEGSNAPVSLGVIPAGATAHLTVGGATRARLAAGAILAVSLEPSGGSPTGQPTGPVVAAGDLKSI